MPAEPSATRPPAIHTLLARADLAPLVTRWGRHLVKGAVQALAAERPLPEDWASATASWLNRQHPPPPTAVLNLTGTVIHTNLGRAPLPPALVARALDIACGANNLEFDLADGRRGQREAHLQASLCALTGAEAATFVTNNAAAVVLVLNTLALGREVPVSRGELIEIGGSFRIPDIMARAGCLLREVGTTNRTHLRDYAGAINDRTALLMQVHPSNYAIQGFTHTVALDDLAALARERQVPLAVDLGSGALTRMARLGLPDEPTPMDILGAGADLVTWSGDKLLGGPQAGFIAGRRDLIEALNANPLKRALRLDKLHLVLLTELLKLYGDPEQLSDLLPVLRLLRRPAAAIRQQAEQLQPLVAGCLGPAFAVAVVPCNSEIGSGALPVEALPSAALAITPVAGKGANKALQGLAAALRQLPTPVLGRIRDGALLLDLRTLEEGPALTAALAPYEAP